MSSKPAVRLPLIVALLASVLACGDAPSSAGIALSAAIPPGWNYLSNSGVGSTGSNVRYAPADLDRAIEQGHSTPLFVVTSATTPKTTLGINVFRSPTVRETSAAALLSAQIGASDGALEVREPPHARPVAGHPASAATLGDGAGNELLVVIVVIADTAFTIAASRPDNATSEVARIDNFIEHLVIQAAL